MERNPHFFKVLLGDFSQRLASRCLHFLFGIPVQFLKHISTATSKRVTLQGPSGRYWNAELGKSSKGTFLCGGWAEFTEDHALREYEFLVFRYDGDFTFTVKIFGVNACEREDLFTVSQRKRRKLCEVNDRYVESSLDVGCVLLSSQFVIHEERSEAQEAANSFTSKFPFTTVKLCRYHIRHPYIMKLPSAFSHTHLPRKKSVLIIKDPNMKSWEVTFIPPKGDNDRLSAGWHDFFRGNDLMLGDFCVFELVKPLQLNVHIFR
ncbi:B3 DNA binding domain-containing protein [Dioscorea alata]|uniref:B3 DNA binding domain-containing protein n=1 Tax=Dioscorea alata TaxID=55571 RepID=A0ACB7WEG5_DIOAL|nr:B3 DNA binding domain-containing protein [Dioscorea alata]